MEQQKTFPTVMFGFEKKAVLDYIYTLDAAAKEEAEKALRDQETLASEITRLQGELEDRTSQQEILKAQLYNEKENAAAHKASFDKLKADTDQLMQIAKNKDNELQIQTELNKQLQNKAADQEGQIKLLLAKLDQLQAEKETADVQIQSARQEADRILAEAHAEADKILQEAADKASESQVPSGVEQLKAELNALRSGMEQKLKSFENMIEALPSAGRGKETTEPPQVSADSVEAHFFR